MKLVTFTCDYADEFDVYGLQLMTDEEAKELEEITDILGESDLIDGQEMYFGTNEYLEMDSALASYSFTDVTDEEAEVIRRTIGEEFGRFYDGDYYLERFEVESIEELRALANGEDEEE